MKAVILAAAFVLLTTTTASACRTKMLASPRHGLSARIAPLAPACREDRVQILDHGRVLADKSFASPDGSNGYTFAKGAWSRDGRYFVFDLTSSGGHSPLNFPTYVFDRKRHELSTFDAAVGDEFLVSGPDFSFEPNGRIALTLWSIAAQSTVKRTLDLSAARPAP